MIVSLPATSISHLLICSGHATDNQRAAMIEWQGVRFDDLVTRVSPGVRASHATFYSGDGYATSLPLADLNNAIVAYRMNGKPLDPEHGYPARIIVPGRYGYKQPKWLQHIIFNEHAVLGHWEQRGHDPQGHVEPIATIQGYSPTLQANQGELIELRGLITPGDTVEISIDNGPWNPASTHDDFHWAATWTPITPGAFSVRIRARRGERLQPMHSQPHLTVRVVE
jgi:hypothetical protein